MWLRDSLTEALLAHLSALRDSKLRLLFSTRRTDPTKLSDAVAELELATTISELITSGKFLKES